uniref:Uncharacterized protein n=1 Tax=Rhizophora mucronata TaxID=61149 RepID=A0A2P2PAU6_RHIMU
MEQRSKSGTSKNLRKEMTKLDAIRDKQ